MQVGTEVLSRSRKQVKKRISSATITSKKIRSILTTRQTCDQLTIFEGKRAQQQPSIRTLTSTKNKSRPPLSHGHLPIGNKCSKEESRLMQLIRQPKHERSLEETVMLRNCCKVKMVHWDGAMCLEGDEKFLVLSADLVMEQDGFWENGNSHNQTLSTQTSTTLSALSHNIAHRSKTVLTGQSKPQPSIPMNQPLNKKNPLLANHTKLPLLIKQWKQLHSRTDPHGRKIVVLWLIKRQSTFTHLMQFSQYCQLPLNGVFYVKRKRENELFDLGMVVKEINQKFLQGIIKKTVQSRQNQTIKTGHMISHNQMNDHDHVLQKVTSIQLQPHNRQKPNQVKSIIASKLISKTSSTQLKKPNRNTMAEYPPNDQNSSSYLNTQTSKQFKLSKKADLRVKLLENIDLEKSNNKMFSKKHMLLQSQTKNQLMEGKVNPVIVDEDGNFGMAEGIGFRQPEIIVVEGIKCNLKDLAGRETFAGKIPLVFGYHEERFAKSVERLRSEGIMIASNQGQNQRNISLDSSNQNNRLEGSIKMFYIKFQNTEQQPPLFKLATSLSFMFHSNPTPQPGLYRCPRLQTYLQHTIAETLSTPPPKLPLLFQPQQQQTQLSQQQEQQIALRAQKRLEEMKRKMIEDVIRAKGRGYAFENGQSVYYFVGDVFKRNYAMLYGECYEGYRKEQVKRLENSNNEHEHGHRNSSNKVNSPQNHKDHSQMTETSQSKPQPHLLKLSPIQFYEIA